MKLRKNSQASRILSYIDSNGPVTHAEIASALGLPRTVVVARRYQMEGGDLVKMSGMIKDASGRTPFKWITTDNGHDAVARSTTT